MSAKVKLIVCDVDGTLLMKNEQTLSQSVFETVKKAKSQNVFFAVASGRSYSSLLRLFKNSNDVIYICSDGSFCVYSEKLVYSSPISQDSLSLIIPKLKDSDFALYAKDCSYASSDYVKAEIYGNENSKVLPISDFSENTPIYKIAISNGRDKSFYAEHYISINRLLRQCYKNSQWTEYVSNDADKGKALSAVQEIFNIKYEETVAIGDNFNDIAMLKKAYFSYSTKNACCELKNLARFNLSDSAINTVNNFLK